MTAGGGYRYLLRSVAAGDGNRSMSTPLTRYYTAAGTPPGFWLGTGIAGFGDGQLKAGMEVTTDQLALLIGMGRDPLTGEQLGRAYPKYEKCTDHTQEAVGGLEAEATLEDCAAETDSAEATQQTTEKRKPVAGYDLTFSVPKSVSVLWGVADAATQQRIVEAHHAAVTEVIDLLEREVAATRTGFANLTGAVAQVPVEGVAAVAYDHYDSRLGDPQLHTHVVVSNKVLTVMDGRWRSLDGRPIFAAATALSALYDAHLADHLSADLGIGWDLRDRGADRNRRWEITGVADDLIAEFSSRSRAIDTEKDRLIAEYIATHGRRPSEKVIVKLRAQATLATRPPKETQSLSALTSGWRERADALVGHDPSTWLSDILGRVESRVATVRLDDQQVDAIAATVLEEVSEKRATWSHWNLLAEASRQTMGIRFPAAADREAAVQRVVKAAEIQSVRLTPHELAVSPPAFRRPDGTSIFRPKHAQKYTSQEILDAEERLMQASENLAASTITAHSIARAARTQLSPSQTDALLSIGTSGRQVDVLVGPAGAGKTSAMRALRHAWIFEHGPGSVVGLAPSSAAAQALADDLGIGCDNTAKWLHEHGCGNPAYAFLRDQLVIVDEATLAGTRTLDQIAQLAAQGGAKVLLVGDPYQLQSVEAGGAFALLADRRGTPAELTEVHRFSNAWEKKASLRLRRGDTDAIATYAHRDRIREGTTDTMLDTAYLAWRADTQSGLTSVLIADSAQAVQSLNERARAERILLDGAATTRSGGEVELTGGTRASTGDTVITRRNDRKLQTRNPDRGGWVKNGDRWTIIAVHRDGSLTVDRLDRRRRGRMVLPAHYVAEHVDLGYATTAHRAQGVTVDTAHVAVSATSSLEALYVGMTRGRESNIAYVALDLPDDLHVPPDHDAVTAAAVLRGILNREPRDGAAHCVAEKEAANYGTVAQLMAEVETLAADAQREHFSTLLRSAGLTPEQHDAVVSSQAFGPLASALRYLEGQQISLAELLHRAVAQHGFEDASDVAAVLRARVQHLNTNWRRADRPPPDLIAGLFPRPQGPMTPGDRRAIEERVTLVEQRISAVIEQAANSGAPWLSQIRRSQTDTAADLSTTTVRAVAAYRDRYGITTDEPLGGRAATTVTQATDRARVESDIRRLSLPHGSGDLGATPPFEPTLYP